MKQTKYSNKNTEYPNAIYDTCKNGKELVEYNGNKDGDWWHNEYCEDKKCLPTPYFKKG